MSRPAARSAHPRPRGPELARFALGVAASVVLVAAAMTALLSLGPALLPRWHTTVVGSGSMQPALGVGDVVVVQDPPGGAGTLGPPTVVLVRRDGLVPLLHRIVDTDGHTYRTKGDANPEADTDRVDPADVVGVGRLLVPYGGWPALWWQRGDVAPLALLALILTALLRIARYGFLDAYDPWLLAAQRTHPDAPSNDHPEGTGTGAGTLPSPAAAPDVSRPRAWRALAAVSAALVVVGATTSASDSAFWAATSTTGTMTAERVAPVGGLTATCAPAAFVVDQVVAGPTTAAPTYPRGTQPNDTLLLSRTGRRPTTSSGGYTDPPTPPGWSPLLTDVSDDGAFHAVYQATATSATGTVPHRSGQADLLVVLRGATVDPAALGGRVNDTGSSVTAPSVDASGPGIALMFWAATRGNVTFSTPTGASALTPAAPPTTQLSLGVHRRAVTAAGSTGERSTTMTDATTGAVVSAQNFSISVFARSTGGATVTWAPSATTRVDGYTVLRGGTVVADVTGRTTTAWTDPRTPSPTTTYTVLARLGTWKSLPANVTAPSGGC